MPIAIAEKKLSRAIDARQATRRFLVTGTDDEIAAYTAVASTLGQTLTNGMVLDEITVQALSENPPLWEALANYKKVIADNELVYNFDLTLETVKVKRSLATIASYAPPGKTAPDFRQAINVQADQKIDGADLLLPVAKFSYSLSFDTATLTEAYAAYLETFVGKYNSVSFRGRPPGEVLFLGASGSQQWASESKTANLDFHFHRRPNRTGITIGDITGINVLGWEYLWVYYETAVDNTAPALIPKPSAAYVERLAEPADLNAIFALP